MGSTEQLGERQLGPAFALKDVLWICPGDFRETYAELFVFQRADFELGDAALLCVRGERKWLPAVCAHSLGFAPFVPAQIFARQRPTAFCVARLVYH